MSSLIQFLITENCLFWNLNIKSENIQFTGDDLQMIIKILKVDKAHVWDNIFIRIIKLFGKSVRLPTGLIFQSIINDRVFPDYWVTSNVVSCYKSKNEIKT